LGGGGREVERERERERELGVVGVGGIWGEARRGGVMWCGRGYVTLSERWDMGDDG
jgi:hypothetical protein